MPKHEFGIIKEIDKTRDYGVYEPYKYDAISIDDDSVGVILSKVKLIKTYYHILSRPNFGLAYYGVTLIPPSSLEAFREVLLNEKREKYIEDLNELIKLIGKAIDENRFIIHFGI